MRPTSEGRRQAPRPYQTGRRPRRPSVSVAPSPWGSPRARRLSRDPPHRLGSAHWLPLEGRAGVLRPAPEAPRVEARHPSAHRLAVGGKGGRSSSHWPFPRPGHRGETPALGMRSATAPPCAVARSHAARRPGWSALRAAGANISFKVRIWGGAGGEGRRTTRRRLRGRVATGQACPSTPVASCPRLWIARCARRRMFFGAWPSLGELDCGQAGLRRWGGRLGGTCRARRQEFRLGRF